MSAAQLDKPEVYRRVVVKIGSGLLVDWDSGRLRSDWLQALAGDLAAFRARGQEVIVVSSGAVALGGRRLGLDNPRKRLNHAQAAAAVGQIGLAHAFEEGFGAQDMKVAQVLLTINDLEDRKRYLNARGTLETLLELGVVPVINENDTVATDEIRFGDNDRLAARVAQMAGADLLILLSDVDGFYTADPVSNPDARRLDVIENITAEMEAAAGPSRNTGYGSGGMVSKLVAARIATRAGCDTLLVDGLGLAPVARYLASGVGSLFLKQSSAPAARKAWLKDLEIAAGTIRVDEGAVAAMQNGKSLLAAGMTGVTGAFGQGDLVVVEAEGDGVVGVTGGAVGRGLAAYSSEDCARILGMRTDELEGVLGYPGRGPVIHRDNFVLEGSPGAQENEVE